MIRSPAEQEGHGRQAPRSKALERRTAHPAVVGVARVGQGEEMGEVGNNGGEILKMVVNNVTSNARGRMTVAGAK